MDPVMKAWADVIGQARELEWQNQGVCRETDPDAFFPEPRDRAFAVKEICATCPVRGKCLEYSVRTNEPFGIWGGVAAEDRKKYLKMGLPLTNEGVDRWFVFKRGKRQDMKNRFKEINSKWVDK